MRLYLTIGIRILTFAAPGCDRRSAALLLLAVLPVRLRRSAWRTLVSLRRTLLIAYVKDGIN